MTSTDDAASETSLSSRSQPRPLRSRIGALFSHKSAQIADFRIELNDPYKTHGPGDFVGGKVILNAARPIGVTHIVVCLLGTVEVFRNYNRPKTQHRPVAPRVAPDRGKRWVTQYYGDGFASLFEEELVLCGEGRLDPKLYHFNFEAQFPKNLSLPSSIEFERGRISYKIVGTLTRPAGLSQVMVDEQPVQFRDKIDVGALPQPSLQQAILNPIERTPRKRASNLKRFATGERSRNSTVSSISKEGRSVRTLSSVSGQSGEEVRSDRPPSPSVASTLSASSGGARRSVAASIAISEPHSCCASQRSPEKQSMDSTSDRQIVATARLEKAGCLPGEVMPVRISIKHHKAIKSLHGIIVTLHRMAYVDQHPNLPIGPSDAATSDVKYEDYYPRSRTGLGGLSLTNAGSSQVWRKDLSQTFAPFYINPATMTADVKVNVKIPEDAFPTLRNAPGDMISFHYTVEVIIDIHGRLATSSGIFPRLGLMDNSINSSVENPISGSDGTEHHLTAYGPNCADTLPLRRNEKQVVSMLCSLVVGTTDSAKAKAKGKQVRQASETSNQTQHAIEPTAAGQDPPTAWHGFYDEQGNWLGTDEEYYYYHDEWGNFYPPEYDWSRYNEPQPYDAYGHGDPNGNGHTPDYHQYHDHGRNHHFPPPIMENDADLSEKDRIRLAEQRLLPSAPDVGPGGGHAEEPAPSAPYLPNNGYHGGAHLAENGDARRVNGRTTPTASIPRAPLYDPDSTLPTPTGTNGIGAHAAGAPLQLPPTDDKQELERRRLQIEASEPPSLSAEDGPSAPPAALVDDPGPSAPTLTEEEVISAMGPSTLTRHDEDTQAATHDSETLPRYEK